MKNTTRYNEVSAKLNKMFNGKSDAQKDGLVKGLKSWLRANKNTEDKAKKEAIECFLAENNIF